MNLVKKLIFSIVLLCAGIGVANAEFRFGIKAGANVNNLHLTDPRDILKDNNGVGWTAGLMTEFKIPVIGLGFDLSVMYTRMNADLQFENVTVENHDFIQIPLNLKYKISLPAVGAIIAPYIFTGPDFSFKLDKNTLEAFKTKTCQVAWNVGLGLELLRHLQIGASYGFGINNIAENYGINTEENIKNNFWTITAAYLF